MVKLLTRLRPDLLALLLLFLLPLGLFWEVTLGGRTLIPADNLFAFEPWRAAASQFGVERSHNELLSDLVLQNYPWKRFIVQSIGAGEAPLWNPYLFAGAPFLANGQHSALYPFSALFYLPGVSLPHAYGAFIVSQLFLAGVCAYVYLRALLGAGPAGAPRRLGALLGGIAYQLSLFMVVSAVFPMILAGAAWLPLFLLALEWIIRQRPIFGQPATLPWVGLGALALGCASLAGHPEILYYSLLVGGAYSAWRLGAEFLRERRERNNADAPAPDRDMRSPLLRRAIYLLLVVFIGLGLGAAQLAPLVEAAAGNFRTGSATFEEVLGWGYPPRHVLAFFMPSVFGNPSHHAYFDLFTWRWTPATVNSLGQAIAKIDWGPPVTNYVEGGAYVGLLTMLLAGLGVAAWAAGKGQGARGKAQDARRKTQDSRPRSDAAGTDAASHDAAPPPGFGFTDYVLRSPHVPFFTLLAALCLAFAFGTPLYALIFWLPGINQLHSPFRWVWVFSLCTAVLAAYGARALQEAAEAREAAGAGAQSAGRFVDRAASLLSILAVGGGSAALLALAALRLYWPAVEPAVTRVFQNLAVAPTAFADARMFFSYEARQAFLFALLLIAAGIVLRLSRCRIFLPRRLGGGPLWQALAVGVLALDLFAAGYGFNAAADPGVLAYTPPVVEFLRRDEGLWRFTTYDPDGRKPFNANSGWYFDFQDVRGYDSIIPRQYAEYMALIEPQGELQYNRIAPLSRPESLDSPLLDLLNVKYVIALVEIDSPKYRLVYDAEVKVYENLGVAPRAFTLPATAAVFGEPREALRAYDPRQYVILDGGPAAAGAPQAGDLAPAEVTAYGQNEVSVRAGAAEAAYLVLGDSYAPGWRAFVRPAGEAEAQEIEVPVLRAAGNFRAVSLAPGEWVVRFKYSPLTVRLGVFISLVAAMALALALGIWLWRLVYREAALDSTARRVAKNSLAPMALNLFNRAVDLIFAAFMLRILGPGDAGKYYFAVVIIVWFDTFAGYGLNTFLTREVARDRSSANRYLANTTILRLILGGAAFVVLAALVFGGWRWLGLAGDTALAILLLAVGLLPSSLSAGLTALFQAFEKHETPAAVTTVTTFLKVSVGAAALALGYGFVGLAASSILVNLATLGLLAGLTARQLFRPRFEFDGRLQRRMLAESGPLMINNLLAGLFFKVDVALLEPLRNAREPGLGSREVGWYSTAYKFIEAFNVVPSLFTFALFPVLARQAAEDRSALARSYGLAVKLLFFTAAPLALATTFLAQFLIGALGGEEFLPHGAIALQLMVWSIPFGWINSVTNYLLIALGRQRSLTVAFTIGLTFNVVGNLLFIPRYGYPAAAIITILSEIVEGIPFYLVLRQAMGPVPWLRLLWKPAVATGAMAGVMAALWPAQPALALLAGAAAYLGMGAALRVFDPEEWATLVDILPRGVRRRAWSVRRLEG